MYHVPTIRHIESKFREHANDPKFSKLFKKFARESAEQLSNMASSQKQSERIHKIEIEAVRIAEDCAEVVTHTGIKPTHFSVYVRYSDFICEHIEDFKELSKARQFSLRLIRVLRVVEPSVKLFDNVSSVIL